MEIILILLGVLIGIGIGYIMTRPKISGCIVIDRSEPDEPPKLFLESYIKIYKLSQKKHVTYEVKNKNYISHE